MRVSWRLRNVVADALWFIGRELGRIESRLRVQSCDECGRAGLHVRYWDSAVIMCPECWQRYWH